MTKILNPQKPLARPAAKAPTEPTEEQKKQALVNAALAKREQLAASVLVAACQGAGADLITADPDELVTSAIGLATYYVKEMYGVDFFPKEQPKDAKA